LRVALLALCLVAAAPSFADDLDMAKLRLAAREADAEYNLGHYREALTKFEAVYKAKPLPALLYNIAQCHRQLGDLRQALVTYKSFIRLDPENPNAQRAKELVPQVEDALAKEQQTRQAAPTDLDQLQGTAVARGTGGRAGTAPTAPAPTRPSSGPASSPAAPSAGHSVPLAAVTTSPRVEQRHERGPVPYLLVGGAVVAAGAGAFFGLQARSAADDWKAATSDPAWSDARSRAQSSMGRANVAFVAAGILAAAGLITYLAF
jgi:tetratricopeptide (TPR) repeat protein